MYFYFPTSGGVLSIVCFFWSCPEFPYGFFVLRHCRTDYNSNHKISGQSNPNLLNFSINTDSLNRNNIQYQDLEIITSPLAWCLQTIYLLQKQSGDINLNIRVDSRIVERGMGIGEGRFKADILQQFPECCYQGHINTILHPTMRRDNRAFFETH